MAFDYDGKQHLKRFRKWNNTSISKGLVVRYGISDNNRHPT